MKILEVHNVSKKFKVGRNKMLNAVDDVSFNIDEGEALGLVGESGSGKSTVTRLLTDLLAPDFGKIMFRGKPLRQAASRRAVQLVFQNAQEALNPAFSIAQNIAVGQGLSRGGLTDDIRKIAALTGINEELLLRRPHQLSGGQQARVGIARALASAPELLLLDEPTAALDVSVQATILRLIDRLRREDRLALLFVSHDLEVVRLMCDRIMVMYLGRIVEEGPTDAVIRRPGHPYTRALVAATPGKPPQPALPSEPISPVNPQINSCFFSNRCPLATSVCMTKRPEMRSIGPGQSVACHHAEPAVSGSGAC